MKAAVALLLVVVVMSSVDAVAKKKSIWKKIKGGVKHSAHGVVKKYKSAKLSFQKLVKGVNFDAALKKLAPLIKSNTTVKVCVLTCTGAADAILGPAASMASAACPPLCQGALGKLGEIAG